MRIAVTRPLFAWDALEDSPRLATLKRFLAAVPDAALLDGLHRWRGRGRDDYPVGVLWGVLLLSIALRHPTIEACLEELRRNRDLRELIGIASEERVPNAWNISRFLEVLGREPHRSELVKMFETMVERLGRAVPDLGRHTAGDATWLNARAKRRPAAARAETKEGLPQPAGGRKEYSDEHGVVTRVVEWFGYKLHVLVDVKHEVALSYQITSTKQGGGETLPALVNQANSRLPAGRIESLAYDKAADTEEVHAYLAWAKIKPLVQNRSLWKDEFERMLPGHDGRSNIVHDEAGTIYCYDRVSQPMVRHPMAFMGYEADRGTLKYRPPGRARRLVVSQPERLWRGPQLRIDRAREVGARPASLPSQPARHQAVRAALQRTHSLRSARLAA